MSLAIYRINGPNNCVYFGSAVNVDARESRHRSMLNKGIHENQRMQRHWNKYGESAFTFSVVEFVEDKSALLNIEQDYIDWAFRYLEPECRYNMCRVAGNWTGNKHTNETKAKMSANRKGKNNRTGIRCTDETKVKIANKHAQEWEFISPEGELVRIYNLKKFCRENNLDQGAMWHLTRGTQGRKQHKGWRLSNVL